MNSKLIYFLAGTAVGIAAGIALSARLTEEDKINLKKQTNEKLDTLKAELANSIEALKNKLETL